MAGLYFQSQFNESTFKLALKLRQTLHLRVPKVPYGLILKYCSSNCVLVGPVRAPGSTVLSQLPSVHALITPGQDRSSFDDAASPCALHSRRSGRVFTIIPPGTDRHKWLSQLMNLLNPSWHRFTNNTVKTKKHRRDSN